MNWIIAHWSQVVAFGTSAWIAINVYFNRVANALPAPTAQDGPEYIRWFKFVNNMAGNYQRANGTKIEDSPNFIPAAEKYMAAKLAERGKNFS